MNDKDPHKDHITQEEWSLLFDLLEEKLYATNTDAKEAFRRRGLGRAYKTIVRTLNVARELFLRQDGPLTEQEKQTIANRAGYGAEKSTVQTGYLHLLQWRADREKQHQKASKDSTDSKDLERLLRIHHDQLLDTVNSLRRCLEPIPPPDAGLLRFRWEFDWRLDPVRWFLLSVPDLKHDDWKPFLDQLKSHTPNWEFWDDFEQLKLASVSLAKEIRYTGDGLAKYEPEFKEVWDKIAPSLIDYNSGPQFRFSRTSKNPEPPREEFTQHLVESDIEYIYSWIDNWIDPLGDTLDMKGVRLMQLMDDLNTDIINSHLNEWIVKGQCDDCPT